MLVSKSNAKLGKVKNWSLTNVETCPGASDWCKTHCYVNGYIDRYKLRSRYQDNRDATFSAGFVDAMVAEIGAAPAFRIHVSGDFFSSDYVQQWHAIVLRCPGTLFWAYTRSWTVPDILPALEKLRALANVQLFASMDATMGEAPESWRRAYISSDERHGKVICMEQTKAKPDCASCGYCFKGFKGDITFNVH